VILSNFRRTRTVPHLTVLHSISSYQTQTALNYFFNKTRVRGVESNYRTIIKNLELFLKARVFLKKKHKISQNTHYFMAFFQKNPSF
jgi:hypothetical protein